MAYLSPGSPWLRNEYKQLASPPPRQLPQAVTSSTSSRSRRIGSAVHTDSWSSVTPPSRTCTLRHRPWKPVFISVPYPRHGTEPETNLTFSLPTKAWKLAEKVASHKRMPWTFKVIHYAQNYKKSLDWPGPRWRPEAGNTLLAAPWDEFFTIPSRTKEYCWSSWVLLFWKDGKNNLVINANKPAAPKIHI